MLDGLDDARKHIPGRWFDDERGHALFRHLTGAHGPLRTEASILRRCAAQIAERVGPGASIVELGNGCGPATAALLDALDTPARYVPIDACPAALAASATLLRRAFARLRIEPMPADFTHAGALRGLAARCGRARTLVFVSAWVAGRFGPPALAGLLERIGQAFGDGALLLVGVDATQDPALLLPAYDDARGAVAAYNKNLLRRINRELGADLGDSAFRHAARFDARARRVEMHLVSEYTQVFTVLGWRFRVAIGESIHTADAYVHDPLQFEALARQAGWAPALRWPDGNERLVVYGLERAH